MSLEPELPEEIAALLRCPRCHASLRTSKDSLTCSASNCRAVFPVVQGIPILIDEERSVFRIEDFTAGRATYFTDPHGEENPLRKSRFLPRTPVQKRVEANFRKFATILSEETRHPTILVLGGGIIGLGLDAILGRTGFRFIETDVSLGPRTMLVCDAHDIPFADGAFDGVIAQAVLEHVVDPYRCVEEIHRVLRSDGLVYAGTPFMQQVHGGAYDFTRFTHRGHRRLFRRFEEIESGMMGGPGMALAWACRYYFDLLSHRPLIRRFWNGFARSISFWLKYTDARLARNPSAIDAASGLYFIGRRSETTLSDRDLVTSYRPSRM